MGGDRALPPEAKLPRHVLAPMADAMMASSPEARVSFERLIAEDDVFASDAEARLRWWELVSPYQERSEWIYPVMAERP